MVSRRQGSHSSLDIWPGFVDALATLLIVVIFVLMTFVVSQLSLTNALQGRDQALDSLNHKLQQLNQELGQGKKSYSLLKQKNQELESSFQDLQQTLSTLKTLVGDLEAEKQTSIDHNNNLITQVEKLKQDLETLTKALQLEEQEKQTVQQESQQSLALKLKELAMQQQAFDSLKQEHEKVLKHQQKQTDPSRLGQYRSEFLAKVLQVIGERSDIRVVGDRFVFQSEVLFDKASAELGREGKKRLDQLVEALKQIATKISQDLQWVLRVDGHTDHLPIKTSQFPSNWELSSARAISVVKYMIEKGIPAHHLVAAGFGEHQPLTQQQPLLNQDGRKEKELARNRRIEFRLDQR